MSTELHNTAHGTGQEPVHKDVAFEGRDIKASSILLFLVALALALGASYYICLRIYYSSIAHVERIDAAPPSVREGLPAMLPPEPRLQGVPGHETDPQQDLRDKQAADRKEIAETRWVDQKAGIAQIPVEEAMKIIAEKGLPAASVAPAEKKR